MFLDHQVREFAGRFGEVRDLRPRDLVDLPALAGVLAHLEEAQPDLVGVAVRGHVVVATEGREVVVNGVFDSERWVASSVTPAPSSSFSAATIRMVFSVVRSGGVDVRSMVVSVVARFVSGLFLAAERRESLYESCILSNGGTRISTSRRRRTATGCSTVVSETVLSDSMTGTDPYRSTNPSSNGSAGSTTNR
jgi:hypothetical protein